MAKSKKKKEVVFLVSEETGDYNYTIRRRTGGEKLKLKSISSPTSSHHPQRKEEVVFFSVFL
jgi:large subunit ribosomal protein L33